MVDKNVKIEDDVAGTGDEAVNGTTVVNHLTGYLNRGERFQDLPSYSFRLGRRDVIAGLGYAIRGMKVGGRRRVRVGPHLAYGSRGVPGVVPPDAVLVFDVELLEVKA